jgi:hypothetical protein
MPMGEPDESRLLRGLVQGCTWAKKARPCQGLEGPASVDGSDGQRAGGVQGVDSRRVSRRFGDQPCIVFLTNRALYVDVWPYEGGTPGLIVAPFHMIAKCEIGRNDVGGTRLAFILDTRGNQNPTELRSIAVDLPRDRHGAAFGHLVVNTVGARAG